VGLTEAGKFHIDKLRLNRPQLVAWRCERQRLTALQTARRQLLQQLQHLGGRLQDLIAQLELELQKRQEP
jgi:hypothetical protein